MSTNKQLVQLGRSPDRVDLSARKTAKFSCPLQRLAGGPIADKFFITGALASILGIGWLGTHLWLILNGEMAMGPQYLARRSLHVLIQVYLFMGLFVLGFIAQAGPRLVRSLNAPRHRNLLWIPLLVAGVVLWHFAPELWAGRLIVAGVFGWAFLYFTKVQREADRERRQTVGRFVSIGLAVYALSPLLDLGRPAHALLFFWGALGFIILGSGQQFISAFLQGARCSARAGSALLALSVAALGMFLAGIVVETGWLWNAVGALTLATLVAYGYATNLARGVAPAKQNALALAFLTGYAWAILGSILLAIKGAVYADLVFHVWAIGWATPLILTVSGQIVSFMAGQSTSESRLFYTMILIWQVVPVGRTLSHQLQLSSSFSWIVTIAATVVLLYWAFQLLKMEWYIWRRAAALLKH